MRWRTLPCRSIGETHEALAAMPQEPSMLGNGQAVTTPSSAGIRRGGHYLGGPRGGE
jgi:hypothetical protein